MHFSVTRLTENGAYNDVKYECVELLKVCLPCGSYGSTLPSHRGTSPTFEVLYWRPS